MGCPMSGCARRWGCRGGRRVGFSETCTACWGRRANPRRLSWSLGSLRCPRPVPEKGGSRVRSKHRRQPCRRWARRRRVASVAVVSTVEARGSGRDGMRHSDPMVSPAFPDAAMLTFAALGVVSVLRNSVGVGTGTAGERAVGSVAVEASVIGASRGPGRYGRLRGDFHRRAVGHGRAAAAATQIRWGGPAEVDPPGRHS